MCALLAVTHGCGCRQTIAPNPAYLELVSLSSEPTDTHAIPISARDGTMWYREAVAGIDLHDCDFDGAVVQEAYDGSQGITFCVKAESQNRLYEWSRQRVGRTMGFVVGGQLVATGRLEAPVGGLLQIPGYTSTSAANVARAELREQAAALR